MYVLSKEKIPTEFFKLIVRGFNTLSKAKYEYLPNNLYKIFNKNTVKEIKKYLIRTLFQMW